MFTFKLAEYLEKNKITRNTLAREAKVRPNVVYEMCDNQTKRIELKTLDKIMASLTEITGKTISISDILEYQYTSSSDSE